MYAAELASPKHFLTFINEKATGGEDGREKAEAVRAALKIPAANVTALYDRPTAAFFEEYMDDLPGNEGVAVCAYGGEGAAKLAVESFAGIVPTNPEETRARLSKHRELVRRILYVPAAGGNANNFARSALGIYSRDPSRLATAGDLMVGLHRPLLTELLEEDVDGEEKVIRQDAAVSCAGVGATSWLARDLEMSKAILKQLQQGRFGRIRRLQRLGREAIITTNGLWSAPSFSAEMTIRTGDRVRKETLLDIDGIEVIGSRYYAKAGRAPCNIDDPRHQIVVARHHASRLPRALSLASTFAQFTSGHYTRKPIDFTGTTLTLERTDWGVLGYQIDGEVEIGYTLSDQKLRLSLAKIAVPVLMRQS